MATPEEDFAQPDTEEVTENEHSQDQGHAVETGAAAGEKRWPGWPGESVFRILVPSQKVGGIIGRKGELVKKMCEESRARIKVLDSPLNVPEKAVMVTAKEEPDTLISPAMDGLLRVLKHVIGSIDELSHPTIAGSMAVTRLLVPATQVGILIGKQGSTIKSVQEASHANIHVCDDLPPFALQDDRVVEIKGEPARVYKAVELIASHLRKFLVDRSVLPLFEVPMPMLHPHMEQNMAPPQRWGHPQGIPMNPRGTGYGGSTQFVPPLPHDNFYPPPDLPPLEKQPHYGISAYGREPPPMGVQLSANQQPPPRISQVTQHMQIPLSYADAVIGSAGSTISYIRRASGATITIQETRGVPGEMTVEINGSATQVQTAQQLIQNFMAEAAATAAAPAAAPVHNSMPPADQGYNSYSTYGSRYASPRGNAGVASYASGGYGSGYGGSYGY